MTEKGLGGLAATRDYVLLSDRELDDTADVFKCLRSDNGQPVWILSHPAPGRLDFGNSPRATPLIHGDLVFLFGAFGQLHCVELATGRTVWQLDLRAEFDVDADLPWGTCASPLLVDDKLIVNPGAKGASIVALAPRTGQVIWKTPGAAPGYGSLIAGTFGGVRQIVGHDVDSLGGWDVATGRRLWRLVPPRPKDFNVPTPIQVGSRLLVATENNGTRLYRFDDHGVIDPRPVAEQEDLAPDTHTPVVVGRRVFGIGAELFCLDLNDGLQPIWTADDRAFGKHASIIASDDRLLITTLDGELLLVDARATEYKLLNRLALFDDDHGVYSHPALVGSRLYVRGSSSIVCIDLQP